MRTIWKYDLGTGKMHMIPKGAKFLTGGIAQNKPCLWFDVDSNAELEERSFSVAGTGHEIPEQSVYLATIPDSDGFHIWHIFENA